MNILQSTSDIIEVEICYRLIIYKSTFLFNMQSSLGLALSRLRGRIDPTLLMLDTLSKRNKIPEMG